MAGCVYGCVHTHLLLVGVECFQLDQKKLCETCADKSDEGGSTRTLTHDRPVSSRRACTAWCIIDV